jgi:hypothetical protein
MSDLICETYVWDAVVTVVFAACRWSCVSVISWLGHKECERLFFHINTAQNAQL